LAHRLRRGWLLPLALAAPLALVAPPASAADGLGAAKAPVGELERSGTVESFAIVVRRYRQRVGGVPVLGAEVVTAQPRRGGDELLADSSAAELDAPPPAEVSRERATAVAERAIDPTELRDRTRAALAIDPGSGRQVWRVLIAARTPLADFEVLVDAASGAVVRSRDLLVEAEGRARVFVLNPVVRNGGLRGLSDNRDRDSSLLTRLRSKIQLRRLRGGSNCLVGDFAEGLVGIDGKVCDKRRRWNGVTRSEREFEALNAYVAVDRTMTYVRALGFRRGIGYRRLPLRTNAIPEDNSAFSFFTRDLIFGRGGVDDAEDADVVIHEFAHALQDSQVSQFGMTDEGGAIGEGFADYMTAVMTAVVPGTSGDDQACIFEWDVSPLGVRCARRTDTDATVASVSAPPCRLQAHCGGLVWSGALWTLRGRLGVDAGGHSVMDRVVLQSNFLLTRRAGFRAAAEALLEADQQLYDGVHREAIAAELTARGLL
jgi:hypothetical protein